MTCPCKDCKNRNMKCHSYCQDYISFQKENERVRKLRHNIIQINKLANKPRSFR